MDIVEGKGAATMKATEHPHIAEVRREIVYDGGRWRHMLVVVTDLSLDPSAPDHDANALNEIIQTVANSAMETNSGYHGITVRNP